MSISKSDSAIARFGVSGDADIGAPRRARAMKITLDFTLVMWFRLLDEEFSVVCEYGFD